MYEDVMYGYSWRKGTLSYNRGKISRRALEVSERTFRIKTQITEGVHEMYMHTKFPVNMSFSMDTCFMDMDFKMDTHFRKVSECFPTNTEAHGLIDDMMSKSRIVSVSAIVDKTEL